ncbi:hypothetical protein HAX54_013478 [Datura stramonium]|uniref:Uncharacterized protein n=1 Tax=Datura stramonium TaxID=4076 RepID=A0ABS8TLA6_DATST|nr:hypothetical protein [Datura stramonium]
MESKPDDNNGDRRREICTELEDLRHHLSAIDALIHLGGSGEKLQQLMSLRGTWSYKETQFVGKIIFGDYFGYVKSDTLVRVEARALAANADKVSCLRIQSS